jgi:hypothetical protein
MADQHLLYTILHNTHASYAHTYAVDQSTYPKHHSENYKENQMIMKIEIIRNKETK